ncbi:hypothetical protein Poli38472_000834 [Pythium oligandrum]|uniref:Uncharacterized protein n=1 Tax=Pythium oligandrum TaxID=41045 RepID=A0A8K1CEK3_PYTOL|nr:hypothetical protein Poli38472_000834 [Pythium oligandrum]|eukprot:TMW60792.1 hypothetical protein Poli38472_000834 [Pythium oligandrum]
MRPREVPIAKPSAEQRYIPRVLLREDEVQDGERPRWLPLESRVGASKHLRSASQPTLRSKVVLTDPVSREEMERLRTVDAELTHLEIEMDKFVHDFHLAATMFRTQVDAQTTLLQRLQHTPRE